MVLVVYGFPHSLHALQFEWMWQNPTKSRQLLEYRHELRAAYSVRSKCHALLRAMGTPVYTKFPLSVRVFSSKVYEELQRQVKKLDLVVDVELYESLDQLPPYLPKSKDTPTIRGTSCSLCVLSTEALVGCPMCHVGVHLICLASLWTTGTLDVLPTTGTCPACSARLKWIQLLTAP
jgi:hypothetical protein